MVENDYKRFDMLHAFNSIQLEKQLQGLQRKPSYAYLLKVYLRPTKKTYKV